MTEHDRTGQNILEQMGHFVGYCAGEGGDVLTCSGVFSPKWAGKKVPDGGF